MSKLKTGKIYKRQNGRSFSVTTRQQVAVANMVKKGMRQRDALRAAGYSESYINTGSPMQKEGLKAYMDEMLGVKKVVTQHQRLLEASCVGSMTVPHVLDLDQITKIIESMDCELINIQPMQFGKLVYFKQPIHKIRLAAVDMAYKLRGDYAPTKSVNTTFSLAELRKLAQEERQINAIDATTITEVIPMGKKNIANMRPRKKKNKDVKKESK